MGGRPEPIASSSELPNVSVGDGNANTSAEAYAAERASPWSRPVTCTPGMLTAPDVVLQRASPDENQLRPAALGRERFPCLEQQTEVLLARDPPDVRHDQVVRTRAHGRPVRLAPKPGREHLGVHAPAPEPGVQHAVAVHASS